MLITKYVTLTLRIVRERYEWERKMKVMYAHTIYLNESEDWSVYYYVYKHVRTFNGV